MAFSQSLLFGENTLNELDNVVQVKEFETPPPCKRKYPTRQSKANDSNNNTNITNFGSRTESTGKSPAGDVIEESPQEKTPTLSQLRQERFTRSRKHLRKIKSDPINSFSPSTSRPFKRQSTMFESPINSNNKENMVDYDSFEKYVENFQTQPKKIDSKPNLSFSFKNCDFLDSKFSMEIDNVNVSRIESIMKSVSSASEDIFATSQTDLNNQIPLTSTQNHDDNDNNIQWDDSNFFDDFNTSVQINDVLKNESIKNETILVEIEINNSIKEVNIDEIVENNKEIVEAVVEVNSNLQNQTKNRSIPNGSETMIVQLERTLNISSDLNIGKCDIRNLLNWGCSELILKEYQKKGIQRMFQWQAECLSNEKIQNENRNLVYSAPTSAGKTFVSEILMISNVLKRKKKVLIILPFISVVREKMYYLQDLLRSSGIRVEGFFGGYTPAGSFDSIDIAVCTIEKANSILNKLLELNKMDTIGLIVVDEVHLISDPGRGYILELLLAKAIFCSSKKKANIQIITMSATLPNTELLINWLEAESYYTDFRPIELQEMIKIGSDIYDNKMNLIRSLNETKTDFESIENQNDQDDVGRLCIETISDGSAVIVFCPSKDWCESLALNIASLIYKIGKSRTLIGNKVRDHINMQLIDDIKNHLKNSPTGLDSVLEKTISYGVAFHHAGLTFDERDILESAFSNGSLKVIVATSTLSSGVNLPARRVIIRTPLFGGKPMSSLTYKQMIGRAGRMGKDTMGESILICSNANSKSGKDLIGATLKPLTSCLNVDGFSHLKRALLEIIASGMATTKEDLEKFIKCTLIYSEKNFEINYFNENHNQSKNTNTNRPKNTSETDENEDPIGRCMNFLEQYEFIRLHFNEETKEMNYIATRLGHACLASSMPPGEGFLLFSELQRARQNFVLESELHAVYLVTPFSVCYQIQEIDWLAYLDMWEKLSPAMQRVGELVGVKESFLVKAMRRNSNMDQKALKVHKRFYTALALKELIDETPINVVASKYKFTRGVLQSLQQTASTFAGIVSAFCNSLNWQLLGLIVSQFKERLFFGVHQDLIDLMRIPSLNGQRARALFSAGFHTLNDISTADILSIEKCLFDSTSFDSKERDGESNYDAQQRNKNRLLFVTGRAGLSVTEAAKIIIDEAREYLQNELGSVNIDWSQKKETAKLMEKIEIDQIIETEKPSEQKTETEEKADPIDTSFKPPENILERDEPEEIEIAELSHRVTRRQSASVDSISMNATHDLDQSLLLNGSNILSDSKVEKQSIDMSHIKIIDVFKSKEFFEIFKTKFNVYSSCGFAIATVKKTYTTDVCNCIISENLYIHGIAICFDENISFYMNLQDQEMNSVIYTEKINFIKLIFSRIDFTIKMSDAKDQLKMLFSAIPEINEIKCQLADPKIAHWLIQSESEIEMESYHIHRIVHLYAPECTSMAESIKMNELNEISPMQRTCVRACIVDKVLRVQLRNLERIGNGCLLKAFKDMEMPIQKSLLKMEIFGISVDRSVMEKLNLEISEIISELETEMYRMNGKRFRTSSSRDLAQILRIKNKDGTISARCTRADIESSSHPMAKLILEHRKLNAILSKTIQPLLRRIVGHKIHGNSISFTSTGRISMHDPNLQNVAKDFLIECFGDQNKRNLSCRRAFAVPEGRQLISADFCQLELRILAHLSKDKSLIDIFSTVDDVFTAISAKWNRISENMVNDQLRNKTKQICYGIIYGMGVKSLSDTLKCCEDEAVNLLESFHRTYPGIRNYTNKIVSDARANGFVETLAGRRRYLPFINSTDNSAKRNQSERQAVNTTIQGSAADIAKYAMLRIERNILKYQSSIKVNLSHEPKSHINLVLHLHDELLYEIPKDKSKNILKILKSSMENCAKLLVPLKVKVKFGDSWGDLKTAC